MTVGRFKQPLWIVPLAIAAVVAVFGWWGNVLLRHTVEQQLRAQLTTTLEANATALEIWMETQKKIASELADEPRIRTNALSILDSVESAGEGFRPGPDVQEVRLFNGILSHTLPLVGYENGQLVGTNFVIAAGGFARRQVSETHTNKYAELFNSGKAVIITPYIQPEPGFPGFRRGGRGGPRGGTNQPPRGPFGGQRGTNNFRGFGPGGPEAFRGRRGDQTLMQVAAPIRDSRGETKGALSLVINPTNEFSRILSVARSGDSGETYAFDQTGLLISESRFDEQLKKSGLLDPTNTSSALNLRLHDPKGETVDGAKSLTRIVADAVSGEDGVDVEPSRDYRGVEVVGAWRWLPDYGFGMATQIDASEAYQPLHVIKLLFTMLCLLLILCATGMFVFSFTNFRWRRRLSEAELRLKQLGQYTLEEKIGEGGMGVVYRARHALMRRETAVKLLMPDRADVLSLERFEREVVLTCQLTHPNTIQVYDYGHTPEGIFYYAMEFLRGVNLHELVARYGPQPEGRVIYILSQVCDALNEAHALGLVHRDIKPANIFLCNRGGVPDWVKVLDFGLVREYGAGKRDKVSTAGPSKGLEGTPWFMPPESIKDSTRSDPRSDIYSVGALGYYLLTGQFVFDGDSIFELCEKHLKETPIPPGRRGSNPVTDELDAIILKCLSKDPNDRPQSAMELRGLLLDSPCATDWSGEARLAWWARRESSDAPLPGESGYVKPTTPDVTVRIDLESRM